MINPRKMFYRRTFMKTVAAGAAAFGVSAVAPRLSAEPRRHEPAPEGVDSWLEKITGKHRQIFDTPEPNEGMAFAWSRVFLMTNKATGSADGDSTAVVVLRHSAIPFAMGHDLWAKYSLGENFKITDKATNAPAVRNPFWQPKPGELLLPDMSVDELLKSNVLIGVCDVALTVYSGVVAKKMNGDAAAVKADWVAGLFPGIQVVPSGVWAVNRAQEHGCTYCFAG
jgi:intracellular sulfur oxidation DsrE/DsrF family protein